MSESIVVQVKHVEDADGEETKFKIKLNTKMKKIFASFASHKSLQLDSVDFIHKGHVIHHDSTASEIGLQDEDVIVCKASTSTAGTPSSSQATAADGAANTTANTTEENADKITIGIKDQYGDLIHYKLNKSTEMKKVFTAYTQRKGVELYQVRFLYDGRRILFEQSPNDLDMEDQDVIHYVLEQGAPPTVSHCLKYIRELEARMAEMEERLNALLGKPLDHQ